MFNYDDSVVRQERLSQGTDHCGSTGSVYKLGELVDAGRITDPRDIKRPLTTGGSSASTGGVLIYAVDTDFNIHVGFDGVRGSANAVKHETLFHNADVRAAGELTLRDGMIVGVNDRSGSYRTSGRFDSDRRLAEAVLTALDRAGAPMTDETRSQLREKAGRK